MYQHGGIDTLVIKEVLGHASIATTEIYTHLSDNQKKYAEQIGVDAYMKEFSTWFSSNTTGSCK